MSIKVDEADHRQTDELAGSESTQFEQDLQAAKVTVMRNLTGDKEPRALATDSMVTVRLSDPTTPLPPLLSPSPTPTLKLVTETNAVLDVDSPSRLADGDFTESPTSRSRSDSDSSQHSARDVDWEVLAKDESEQVKESKDQEEKTAFLIARLEKENSRLESDPKAGISREHERNQRPPSLYQLKKLMTSPCPEQMRYSMLPSPPPLTDLEFYGALVADYQRCASKLPFLLSKKIKAGIPPPLRGVVWISMAGARDSKLEDTFNHYSGMQSPFDAQINKDVRRTGLELFEQDGGEGQRLLGRVLRAFSHYDTEVGYCQGFGFLVGPILMHMGDKEAFCVMVRLMEHYEMRSTFLPGFYGLRMRLYQYQQILKITAPDLYAHFEKLGIHEGALHEPVYATKWFLSFFAISCPLPILLRIYDIIFAEGAGETLMRVAISLIRKNEEKLLAMTEFDDVMQMLLSRALWDVYGFSADSLVADFDTLSSAVTGELLSDLEARFKEEFPDEPVRPTAEGVSPSEDVVQTEATKFLGRTLLGSIPKLSLAPSKMNSEIRKSNSKQSLSSTISSLESTQSGSTLPSSISSASSVHHGGHRSSTRSVLPKKNKDEDLHGQIEDLLTAMSTLQRENAAKDDELSRMRQAQEDERSHTRRLVDLLSGGDNDGEDTVAEISKICDVLAEKLRFSLEEPKAAVPHTIAPNETASQIAEELQQTRRELLVETAKAKDLEARVAEQNAEIQRLKAHAAEIRNRWESSHKEKQRLERTISDFRQRKGSFHDLDEPKTPPAFDQANGLREFKLGRSPSSRSQASFSKRSSSLGMQSILASDSNNTSSSEALLMELVTAKTAEATAKQEAEEAKAKLQALRTAIKKGSVGSLLPPGSPSVERTSFGSFVSVSSTPPPAGAAASAASVFSSWTGWGKRASP